MKSTSRYWAPSSVPPRMIPVLAVENRGQQPMEPWLHRELLRKKLERLLAEAGPVEADAAMGMSEEYLPELATIRLYQPQRNWADAIMQSDTLSALVNRIDWSKEGSRPSPSPRAVKEILEEQSLRSLLEML